MPNLEPHQFNEHYILLFFIIVFLFRNCTEVQKWFNEFAAKVESKATNGAIKILKRTFPACGTNEAWIPPYDSVYKECTLSLVKSDPQILAAINDIEAYSKV